MNRQKSFENERPTLYLVATPTVPEPPASIVTSAFSFLVIPSNSARFE